MSRLRIAQAGVLALHADLYRETLLLMRDEVDLVGFFDPDPDAVRSSIPISLAHLPLYADLGELLDRTRPDVVMVSGICRDMPAWALRVAEAGSHVWIDKPVAAHSSQIPPLAEAIARRGLVVACGYTWRFHPITRLLIDLRRDGTLGTPWSIEFSHITSSVQVRGPWRWQFDADLSGGGILNWLAVHWIDLMRVIGGSEVVEVSALEANVSQGVRVEEVASVGLRFANGMLGSVHIGYLTPGGDELAMGVRGSNGWARWDFDESRLTVRSSRPSWAGAPRRTFHVPPSAVGGYGPEGMAHLRAFFAQVRGEQEIDPLQPGLNDARRLLEVVEAAHESARTGRLMRLGT